MKKTLLTLPLLLLSFSLSAQLTDAQVVELAKQAHEQGMSQADIAAMLAEKGVTRQQAERIVGGAGHAAGGADSRAADAGRLRAEPQLPEPHKGAGEATDGTIFGHDVFNNKSLTFEPSLNIATPDNYVLGPGDEVIIDIWGESEQTVRQTISPDGTIVIGRLGPVVLNGLTVKEADVRLRKSLSRIYSTVEGERPATFVKLSLGQLRSIQIHVMGEVANPGTYTVSSLASLFHVLYTAGGVNAIGSLRSIGVNRGGSHLATVDVYSYLLEGRTDVDITLKDGDIVMVAPYENLVRVSGGVKRPMGYEMKQGETMATLLGFAGGFTGDSYRDAVTVVRRSGRMHEVHNIGAADYARFALTDGDRISVGGIIDRFENRLEITGAVFRPGLYAVSDSVSTIGQLVARAEGLKGDAFTARAILTREKPDYSHEVLPVDVGAILAGTAPDVALRNNDALHIPSIFDLREGYTVTMQGAVGAPGQYPYADNLSIEDMIVKAGGLLESASTARVDVYRRVKDPSSTVESDVRSESFTFTVRDGLVITGGGGFTLKPFDIVTVRTSPGYEVQHGVSVNGEVLFPGGYALLRKGERLSDLVGRAGGTLGSAYIGGARLVRQMDDDERRRMESVMKLTRLNGQDSLSLASLNIASTYSVGIELDKALADPGSDHDLVLEEGDQLHVPEYVGTVTISGGVLYPNTVAYREGMTIGDYVDQAGGYAHRARRGAKIVVAMNGTVTRVKALGGAKITPGCEIVIPYKTSRVRNLSLPELLSLGLSTTSTAAIIMSLIK